MKNPSPVGYWCPTVNCKNPNCVLGTPTFLPYPNPPRTDEGQPDWPKADWKAFVVCRWCEHGYEYTKRDVQWGSSPSPGLPPHNAFLRVLLQCGHKNCDSLVIVHVRIDVSTTPQDRDRRIAKGCSNARCKEGHHPSLLPKILSAEMENEI